MVARNSTQRPVVAIVLLMALLTQLEYPFLYALVAGGRWPGALLLTVRNGLLVWATIWSGLRLWRTTREEPATESAVRQPPVATSLDATQGSAEVELSGV